MADEPILSGSEKEQVFEYEQGYEIKVPKKKKITALPVPEDIIKSLVEKIEKIENQKAKWMDVILNIALGFFGGILSNLLSIGSLTKVNIWVGFVGFGFCFVALMAIYITARIMYKGQKEENLKTLKEELKNILNSQQKEDE